MKQIGKIRSNHHLSFGFFGAFTFVELLVSISILATVSIVGYVSYSGHLKGAYNTTRIQTIDSLHLSLSDYYQMKKTLPDPNSNFISYDTLGTYAHSMTGAYGVSGYVSNNFLPSGYVNFGATDPESFQYYGYGKLLDGSNSFDVASVLFDDATGGYKTYIRGTYDKQRLVSLIRSYSSSSFVSQNSTEDLPYNPHERKLTAYISSYSGSVTINADSTRSLTGELNSGDRVTVATGATALLHISDGSELSLGSSGSQTQLSLSSLTYSTENNLASKVSLFLSLGEVWVEAPHLRTETDSASDFSIQTDSAVAAIRGTVFGMTNSSTGITSISLEVGKLDVKKNIINPTSLTEQFFTSGFTTSSSATGGFILDSSGSHMIVPDGGTPIRLGNIIKSSNSGTMPATSTGVLDKVEISKKIQRPPFSRGYRPKADRISFTGGINGTSSTGILSLTFDNPGADSYVLYFGTGELDMEKPFPLKVPGLFYTGTIDSTNTGPTTITGAFQYLRDGQKTQRTYALRVCFQGTCSAPDIKVLRGETFSFDNFPIRGEMRNCPLFAEKGCKDTGLVAYAPYDGERDLRMYTIKNQFIEGMSNGILDQNFSSSIFTYPNYVRSDKSSEGIPRTFTSSFENGYDTTDTGLNKETLGILGYPGELGELGIIKYFTGSSFFQYIGGGGGIFLDNWNQAGGDNKVDYLTYNLSQFSLKDAFRIEMSVRGVALKRPTIGSGYVLFDALGTFSSNGLRLSTDKSGSLLLGTHDMKNNQIISNEDLESKIPNENKFYRVIASYKDGKSQIQIFDGASFVLKSSAYTGENKIDSISPGVINMLNVGSYLHGSTYINQWNDIINSVKIFKY